MPIIFCKIYLYCINVYAKQFSPNGFHFIVLPTSFTS